MYYPLAIREVAPSSSETEVAAEGVGAVSEEGIPAALTSGEPTKEADPPGTLRQARVPLLTRLERLQTP